MEPYEAAKIAVKALSDKKGLDIRLLKTTDLTVLADYFVICTASSTTHVKSLVDEADRCMSEAGQPPLRREGFRSGNWVLLDCGSVIIHIFLKETRDFYNLERLWSDAQDVDISQIEA